MTPTKIKALRDGVAAGLSVRAIAEQLGVGVATVVEWKKKDVGGGAEKKVRVEPPSEEAVAAVLAAPLPARGDPEALVLAKERQRLVQDLLAGLTAAVADEEYPATSFVTLAKYGDQLVTFIAELSPPAPKDPNEDPDVLESEKILVARLNKLVTEREKREGLGR